ncbi:MAG TPA: YlxR family protein [Clostridiaceae bacterium]|jgi:predicted RNA-binding protein YlxR (DUF448 family)|nr:YlxR family protein [Clostridiaceae bacterium]
MAVKYVPERQCVVCRNRFAKPDLIRFVNGADGGVSLDPSGRMNGRGAYLCHNAECHEKARKAGIVDRHLKRKVDDSIWEALAGEHS